MLDKIKIVNMQSLEELTYDFSSGLNVIIAENNTGKSVLFKVLTFLTDGPTMTAKERRQYIRFGADKADIYIYADDKVFWIEGYSNKLNFYSGTSIQRQMFRGNTMPKDLEEALSLLICENGLIANVIDENQSRFLVESDSRINTSIINRVTKCEKSEKLLEVTGERIKTLNSEIRVKQSQKHILVNELSRISKVDLTDKETRLKDSKVLLFLMEYLVNSVESLENITSVKKIPKETKGILDLIKSLNDVSHNLKNVQPVKKIPKEFLGLSNLVRDLNGVFDNLKKAENVKCPSEDFVVLSKLTKDLNSVKDSLKSVNYVKPFPVKSDSLNFIKSLSDVRTNLGQIKFKRIPSEEEMKSLRFLNGVNEHLRTISELKLKQSNLESEAKEIKDSLDSLEGEVYDCPVHGTIKFVDGKNCVPYYK